MYLLNKVVWFFASPLNVGLVLTAVGFWLLVGGVRLQVSSYGARGRRMSKWGKRTMGVGVGIVILLSLPVTSYVLGWGLERNYVERTPQEMPEGDVALDLGGDWHRAWYAAELVKAGKARVLIASGVGIEREDAVLIRNLGVTEDQLIVDGAARNTEENVKFAKRICESKMKGPGENQAIRVLVVTTAVHMPRSLLLMKKYWPEAEAIAAPTDFGALNKYSKGVTWESFIPSCESIKWSLAYFHEYLGYVAYRWVK